MIYEKTRTLLWFAKRPSHWAHAFALAQRKFLTDHDTPDLRGKARRWAEENAVTVDAALSKLELHGRVDDIDPALFSEARARASEARTVMGGAGDLRLLFNTVRLSGASRVLETGVAYGWSSLAILSAFQGRRNARLVSVDMPYPKLGNEEDVGIVVPERLQENWTLVRKPDRNGILEAISELGGQIDLCHYDSDKSWWGRHYAFPVLWNSLKAGGVFISDDIQDNLYFSEFARRVAVPFAVTECEGKFVGIMRKPPLVGRV